MPRQAKSKPRALLHPVYPISSIMFERGFIANLERSISRNEKAIVARQVKVLQEVIYSQGKPLGRMDATSLFLAACHKRGSGVSQLLIDAGLRAHTSTAMKAALDRGHLDVFCTQVDSMDQHEPITAYTNNKTSSGHPLAAAMLKGLVEPLGRLLDKPVPLDEFKRLEPHKMPVLSRAQVAQWLLSIACTSPPPHKAIKVVDLLIEAGAKPLDWRFGLGDKWVVANKERNWACTALAVGNLDLGVALIERSAGGRFTQYEKEALGKKAGCAVLDHASVGVYGPTHLEPRHRKAMESINEMGFPMPTPVLDAEKVWSCRTDSGERRQLSSDSGLWLHALSCRGHMAVHTDQPQGPGSLQPRF